MARADRIYVSIYYLKTLHYLFFSFAVFSLTAGVMLSGSAFMESLSFFGMSLFYCASSLFIAYRFYRDYREAAEPFRIIRLYFLPYISLVPCTMVPVVAMILTFPSLAGLVYSFLFINYYMLFVIAIGFAASRLRMISKLFEMYGSYTLGKARRLAEKHALFPELAGGYKIGSDPAIDEILDGIWAHRDYPLPYVRMFETAACERHIIDINRTLGKMKDAGGEKDALARSLESMKEDYHRKIREIEQKKD